MIQTISDAPAPTLLQAESMIHAWECHVALEGDDRKDGSADHPLGNIHHVPVTGEGGVFLDQEDSFLGVPSAGGMP